MVRKKCYEKHLEIVAVRVCLDGEMRVVDLARGARDLELNVRSGSRAQGDGLERFPGKRQSKGARIT